MSTKKTAAQPKSVAARKRAASKPSRQESQYASAVERFNNGRFAAALTLFRKVTAGDDPGLRHRAGVYMRICEQRTSAGRVRLRGAEEHYNYGVQLVNDRRLDEAEQHLSKALKLSKRDSAHIHYALAALYALRDDAEAAYENLKKAIEKDPRNRVLARSDSDLAAVAEDPRIAGLLTPKRDGQASE